MLQVIMGVPKCQTHLTPTGGLFTPVSHINAVIFLCHKGQQRVGNKALGLHELSSCFLGFQKSTLRALENRLRNGVRKGEHLFSPFPNFSPTYFSVNLLRDLPNQGCKANAHRGIRNFGVQWDR